MRKVDDAVGAVDEDQAEREERVEHPLDRAVHKDPQRHTVGERDAQRMRVALPSEQQLYGDDHAERPEEQLQGPAHRCGQRGPTTCDDLEVLVHTLAGKLGSPDGMSFGW